MTRLTFSTGATVTVKANYSNDVRFWDLVKQLRRANAIRFKKDLPAIQKLEVNIGSDYVCHYIFSQGEMFV